MNTVKVVASTRSFLYTGDKSPVNSAQININKTAVIFFLGLKNRYRLFHLSSPMLSALDIVIVRNLFWFVT